MSKRNEDNILVSLDIGTSKVVAIVAAFSEDNSIEVLGIGSHSSRGLKKGVVVNIDATVQAIRAAIEEAESMASIEIKKVAVGIAGSHIGSINSDGIVRIKSGEVCEQDIENVIEAARAVAIPADQKIIHVIPQEFIIDGQAGIREPIGMSGVRLEAKVHMVTGSVSAAQNIVNCVRRCNLDVEDIILEQLASSYAVLSEDEKELGVLLVDIGGGTTDIAIFNKGAISYTSAIPVAGDQVTNDVAVVFNTPTKSAENIKINYGVADKSKLTEELSIEVPCIGGKETKQISNYDLASVIESRYEELFYLIKQQLKYVPNKGTLGAGIVLTGGSSKIKGIVSLAEKILEMPARVGVPTGIKGINSIIANPIYSTSIGLLLYSQESKNQLSYKYAGNNFREVWGKLKHWIQGNL